MGLFDNMFTKQRDELNEVITELRAQLVELQAQREAEKRLNLLSAEATKLKSELENLRLSKDRLTEENAREKREVLHMVGLERKRQEFEAEQARKGIETAKNEAVLKVREENLKVEREAFKKEMDFREQRFTKEVGYLKDLMSQILERLPTVTVERVDKTSR